MLLRIEVRNMKKERFNRLFGTGCATFFLLFCLSKKLFVLPKKVSRVSRFTNENYTLFRNLPKRGQKIQAARISTPQSNGEIFMCTHKKKSTSMTFVSETQYASFTFFSATCSNGGDATMSSEYKSE